MVAIKGGGLAAAAEEASLAQDTRGGAVSSRKRKSERPVLVGRHAEARGCTQFEEGDDDFKIEPLATVNFPVETGLGPRLWGPF